MIGVVATFPLPLLVPVAEASLMQPATHFGLHRTEAQHGERKTYFGAQLSTAVYCCLRAVYVSYTATTATTSDVRHSFEQASSSRANVGVQLSF